MRYAKINAPATIAEYIQILFLVLLCLLIELSICWELESWFASGEAFVKLEDNEQGTKLIYEVEANVGGKIAQVGSRLIDMTAKKMADIFFGKFSELISVSDDTNKDLSSQQLDNSINNQSNAKSKIWMYSAIVAGALILAYLIF